MDGASTSIILYKIACVRRFVYYIHTMDDLEDIARTIKAERKRSGLTQAELAMRSKVSRALIAKLETNKYPEIGVLKLLRVLGVLGLDIRITSKNRRRPTLDDLVAEEN